MRLLWTGCVDGETVQGHANTMIEKLSEGKPQEWKRTIDNVRITVQYGGYGSTMVELQLTCVEDPIVIGIVTLRHYKVVSGGFKYLQDKINALLAVSDF